MELQSDFFELIRELAEYLSRGEGVYSVENSPSNLFSVTVAFGRNESGEIDLVTNENTGHIQFFVNVVFMTEDEKRGRMTVCLCPVSFMLVDIQRIPLTKEDAEEDAIQDKIKAVVEQAKQNGPSMNKDNQLMWSKCLVNYLTQGQGGHSPSFVDSIMGMSSVKVRWMRDVEDGRLINCSQEHPMFQCSVSYRSDEVFNSGSIVFQVLPFDINFSS